MLLLCHYPTKIHFLKGEKKNKNLFIPVNQSLIIAHSTLSSRTPDSEKKNKNSA